MKKSHLLVLVLLILAVVFGLSRETESREYTFFEFSIDQSNPTEMISYDLWLADGGLTENKMDGDLGLVSTGPVAEELDIDTGECGACTKNTLDVFLVDHSAKTVARVMHKSSRENVCEIDYEYRIEDDFTKVTEYSGSYLDVVDTGEVQWSSISHCFNENKEYVQCATGKSAPPDYQYASLEGGWCPEALMLINEG